MIPSHQLLKGKRGLIFGVSDEMSLAWHVALQAHNEGADIILTNKPFALQMGNVQSLAERINSHIIPCDATNIEQLRNLIRETMAKLGGQIDFVLHAVALSNNIRRHRTYDNINYTYFMQTLDISALSLHKFLQTALQLNAIAEWGSVVALTYIASQRPIAGYIDMGDAKALLESISRSFGQLYGEKKHVRINTISQSPTLTKATTAFHNMDIMRQYTNDLSPLGNATPQSCANLCVMLFSDYTRYVTMQTIFNDGGFAANGLTNAFIRNSPYVKNGNDNGI